MDAPPGIFPGVHPRSSIAIMTGNTIPVTGTEAGHEDTLGAAGIDGNNGAIGDIIHQIAISKGIESDAFR